jgi:hypothetical protein
LNAAAATKSNTYSLDTGSNIARRRVLANAGAPVEISTVDAGMEAEILKLDEAYTTWSDATCLNKTNTNYWLTKKATLTADTTTYS